MTDMRGPRYTGSSNLEDIIRNRSWRGDINGIDFDKGINNFPIWGHADVAPNMQNDDYKADLDAANTRL